MHAPVFHDQPSRVHDDVVARLLGGDLEQFGQGRPGRGKGGCLARVGDAGQEVAALGGVQLPEVGVEGRCEGLFGVGAGPVGLRQHVEADGAVERVVRRAAGLS
ncbi:hypothetical protein SANTM175S_09020 [Streptomyces antimycoticus]